MVWGRPLLVSLFSERKEQGQKLSRKTLTPSFQNQAGLLRTSFQAVVLSIDLQVLTSLLMDLKKLSFSPKMGERLTDSLVQIGLKINFSSKVFFQTAHPGCYWAGA